jgi:hypothetical protein
MRIMLVSERLPYLPCHDAFRVLRSHEHLYGRLAAGNRTGRHTREVAA